MESDRNSFKTGTLEMLILSLLNHKDLYGYEISMLLKELSDGNFVVPEGSLYPALYKLEDRKYIISRSVQTGKRRVRKYYHIEKEGEKRLSLLLSEYRRTTDGIDMILRAELSDDMEEG